MLHTVNRICAQDDYHDGDDRQTALTRSPNYRFAGNVHRCAVHMCTRLEGRRGEALKPVAEDKYETKRGAATATKRDGQKRTRTRRQLALN